jgi:N-methylhydantoinase B
MLAIDIDPVELELTRNLLEAAADEMGSTLQRVSFSANIKERRDFSCAIFDSDGRLLGQAAHIPVHLGSMPASVAAVRQGLGELNEGDVAIVNDPFAGGTHLPDITIVTPVFAAGERVGYAANRAHHADVGGISPGSMTLGTHIDQEGIRIEPVKLIVAGVRNQPVFDRILSAVRTPAERLNDLEAQIAANAVGARALKSVVESHGVDHVRRYGRALLDYSRAFMAAAIDAIPDGVYGFEDRMDDDGAGNFDIAIKAVVTIAGDTATVDLRGSAPQAAGCINCPRAVAVSAAYYCFACLLDPGVPLNGGCFGHIDVLTTAGTVCHARYPAAVVAGNTETSQRIVDVIFGALARAVPDRIPAASCGTMNSVALGADATGGGIGWTYYETIGGGSGGGPGGPGASAIQCHMTNTLNTPAEAIELQYPLRVRRFERDPGTGGHGRHRGGDGIIREIEALAPTTGTLLTDRRLHRPYGLAGGRPGSPGENWIIVPGDHDRVVAPKAEFELKPGDRLRIMTPGGGGWGDPTVQ